MPDPAALVGLAGRLADAAGLEIRARFRRRLTIEAKGDATPVTEADRAAESAMRAILAAERPGDAILGEELGGALPEAGYAWVLDPIDGTKAFTTGRPTFVTLIGLLRDGVPVLGVIDQPIVGDRWVGAVGRATTHNGTPVATRPCPALDGALLSATSPEMFAAGSEADGFRRLAGRCRYTTWGGDGYAYGLLASGHLDLVCEAAMALHDLAALAPVVTGAGGVLTDWRGRQITAAAGRDAEGRRVLACGDPSLHGAARACLTV